MTTPAFQASSLPARAGYLALALVITVTLLASIGQVADRQFDQALMAQAATPHLVATAAPTTRS